MYGKEGISKQVAIGNQHQKQTTAPWEQGKIHVLGVVELFTTIIQTSHFYVNTTINFTLTKEHINYISLGLSLLAAPPL